MNCERFQTAASELTRGEMMDVDERAAAMAHADQCLSCQRSLVAQRDLTIALSSLAAEMNALEAPPAMEQRVLFALRERTSPQPISIAPAPRRYRAMAIAAALLVCASAIVGWQALSLQPAEIATTEPINHPVALPSTPTPPVPLPIAASTAQPRPPHRVIRPNKRSNEPANAEIATLNVPRKNIATSEVATEFVPVGYGSALDLQYGARLVRVEMPRYALARFGLPMNMERLDEKVKADVLVGNDGLARAIRFVNLEVR